MRNNTIENPDYEGAKEVKETHVEDVQRLNSNHSKPKQGAKNSSNNSMMTDNDNSGSVRRFKTFQPEFKSKLLSYNKNILVDLPFKNMQNVCHMLDINDM